MEDPGAPSLARRAARGLRELLLRVSPRAYLRLLRPRGDELGWVGEELAARTLRAKGHTVCARRLRTTWGELDVVTRDGPVLVCVEVKAGRLPRGRRGPEAGSCTWDLRWRPGQRVDHRRLARLTHAARKLAGHGLRARVDLVEVLVSRDARHVEVVHHEDLRRPLGGC